MQEQQKEPPAGAEGEGEHGGAGARGETTGAADKVPARQRVAAPTELLRSARDALVEARRRYDGGDSDATEAAAAAGANGASGAGDGACDMHNAHDQADHRSGRAAADGAAAATSPAEGVPAAASDSRDAHEAQEQLARKLATLKAYLYDEAATLRIRHQSLRAKHGGDGEDASAAAPPPSWASNGNETGTNGAGRADAAPECAAESGSRHSNCTASGNSHEWDAQQRDSADKDAGDNRSSGAGGGSADSTMCSAHTAQAAPETAASQLPALQEQHAQLLRLVYDHELLLLLASSLPFMEFESRKDAAAVFNNMVRRQAEERNVQVGSAVLDALLLDYARPQVALHCGSMLRETLRHEQCARALLASERYWLLFSIVQMSNFDVTSDAFGTLRESLTRHRKMAAEFLLHHYERFFQREYNALLRSQNYVTRRQSLKLLSEVLLERANFRVMTQYIVRLDNLKLVMNLLLDPSRAIQWEAFHIFKVMVANPKKPDEVKCVLAKNHDKLVRYLCHFHEERDDDDESFVEDKRLVLAEIDAVTEARRGADGNGGESDGADDANAREKRLGQRQPQRQPQQQQQLLKRQRATSDGETNGGGGNSHARHETDRAP